MPEGETLWVSLVRDHDHLVVTLRYGAKGLAEEDLEHFFFPRCAGQPGCEIHNLPLAKIIIHRHGGSVLIFRDREDKIVLKIELPVRFLDSSTGSKRDPGNSKGGPQGETELT
jgi:nitrogen-specific signal transduction histidine kinase